MSRIVALLRKRGRVVITLADGFSFGLSAALAAGEGLRIERDLSREEAESLIQRDLYQRGLDTAGRLLAIRPRSTVEIRTKLTAQGFDSNIQNKVIAALQAQGLINDRDFARFWAENRNSFSPRSRQLTSLELRRKGVARDVIAAAVATIDDEQNAYRLALERARHLHRVDRTQFRRRMGSFLQRRGFGYAVIENILKRVWNDIGNDDAPNTGYPDFDIK